MICTKSIWTNLGITISTWTATLPTTTFAIGSMTLGGLGRSGNSISPANMVTKKNPHTNRTHYPCDNK